jgi:riboflavin kinase/FMN adenylyltransferase
LPIYKDIKQLPPFQKAILTIGTFDGVHKGHKTILDEVVRHADQTGGARVLLTFEPHPRTLLFPNQPLQLLTTPAQKTALIEAAGIDHVVVVPFTAGFAAMSADAYVRDFLVAQFRPAAIVIGYDHHFGHDRKGNIHLLRALSASCGFEVFEIPAQLIDEAAVSSTKIRKAIALGQVREAAPMLGRFYALPGTVLSGAKRGRTLGYPTANILPETPEQLLPALGAYAVQIAWREQFYPAMLNIGYNPTVSDQKTIHVEAHLFDFDQDLYGEKLEIHFVDRIRDEQKFTALESLKNALQADEITARRMLLSMGGMKK